MAFGPKVDVLSRSVRVAGNYSSPAQGYPVPDNVRAVRLSVLRTELPDDGVECLKARIYISVDSGPWQFLCGFGAAGGALPPSSKPLQSADYGWITIRLPAGVNRRARAELTALRTIDCKITIELDTDG